MQIVSGFLAAVALVGTVFGIVNWYFSYRGTIKRRDSIALTIIAAIIFFTFLFGYLSSLSGTNSSITRNNIASTSLQNTTAPIHVTPTITIVPTLTPTPTFTPTPRPTITPTPLPYTVSQTGDVCQPQFNKFQASGWVAENNSFVFSGSGTNAVISPCTITTPNYSVEATIMRLSQNSNRGVGVISHSDVGGQHGYAAGAGCRDISFGECGFFINDYFASIMGIDQEDENLTGQTHTYKLVVNGVTLQLFYDNGTNPIVTKSLATYLQAGYAGFECYDQCVVTGFKVIAL